MHHNIPSSRGGSPKKQNLSNVRIERHDDFHAWAWNYPPHALIRLMTIHSTGMRGENLPSGAVRDILECLTCKKREWESYYDPGTMMSPQGRKEKTEYFESLHILDEMQDTYRLIGELCYKERLPFDREAFYKRALLFFRTSCPQDALRMFLTERQGHDLSWTKALQKDVHAALLFIIDRAKPEHVAEKQKERVIMTLREHIRTLSRNKLL